MLFRSATANASVESMRVFNNGRSVVKVDANCTADNFPEWPHERCNGTFALTWPEDGHAVNLSDGITPDPNTGFHPNHGLVGAQDATYLGRFGEHESSGEVWAAGFDDSGNGTFFSNKQTNGLAVNGFSVSQPPFPTHYGVAYVTQDNVWTFAIPEPTEDFDGKALFQIPGITQWLWPFALPTSLLFIPNAYQDAYIIGDPALGTVNIGTLGNFDFKAGDSALLGRTEQNILNIYRDGDPAVRPLADGASGRPWLFHNTFVYPSNSGPDGETRWWWGDLPANEQP